MTDGTIGMDALHAALRALRTTVAGVRPDQWRNPTPCSEWDATQVLQHAAGDQLAWASFVGGQPMPGFDPFRPSGHLDGTPEALADQALEAAAKGWSTLDPEAADVPTPLPQGALSAGLAARACALDAGVHAWDLAVATGQPSPLTPELVPELRVAAEALVEPLRAYGAYAPARPHQDGDDEAAALLRYLGRDPGWRP
jgi:uncharacterized protein (TIGR03086 family)